MNIPDSALIKQNQVLLAPVDHPIATHRVVAFSFIVEESEEDFVHFAPGDLVVLDAYASSTTLADQHVLAHARYILLTIPQINQD